MPDPFDDAPAALPVADDSSTFEDSSLPAAADTVDTPAAGGTGTAPADDNKRQQNLLAQRGRELKAEREARARAERTAAELAERQNLLEQQLNQMRGEQDERSRQETEAALNRLPPDQRQEARISMLQEQINQLTGREAARIQAQQRLAYRDARKEELVRMANEHYGLTGEQAIRGNEQELDARSEATFIAGLRAMGATRQQLGTRASAPAGTGSGEDQPVAPRRRTNGRGEESELDRLRRENEELRAERQRATGVTRPNSPRPAGGGVADGSDLRQIVRGKFTSHQDRMRQLQAARDEIAAGT